MIQKKIIDYVTQTPHNVNPQVLKTLLETETSPNTGIVSIPIRGHFEFGDKISDYYPDSRSPLASFLLVPRDDEEGGLVYVDAEIEETVINNHSVGLIKFLDEPMFLILPVDIPEENLFKGIYFYKSFPYDIDFMVLSFLDVEKINKPR